ncbi:MAG TPA: ATP-binding protein [Terriglobia bacterium]|nr:ATP-binding protein [Terriglobia bacterium]
MLARWALAPVLVGIASAVDLILQTYDIRRPTPEVLLVAIVITVWYGGTGPGLLAVTLAVLSLLYFFLPPNNSFVVSRPDLLYAVSYIFFAVLTDWFSSVRRRTERALEHARSDLEIKVAERTAELEVRNQTLQLEVAERKRAEEELRRSEAYLAQAQHLSHTGSWAWASTSGMVSLSQEALRIYGLNIAQASCAPDDLLSAVVPEDSAGLESYVTSAIQEHRDFEVDYRITLPDGTVRFLHSVGRPVVSGSGELAELIGTTMDVTDRKLAEQGLQEAKSELAHVARVQAMGELTASIAHEINQPLAAVVANADACTRLLARESINMAELRDAVGDIAEAGARAGEVIARIRAFLRKTPVPVRCRLDLNGVIQEVLDLTRSELDRHGVALRCDLESGLPEVQGDRVELQQVILNLVMNSIEAMAPETGRPRVLAIGSKTASDGAVQVTVSDSGIGLPAETPGRIFDAFFTTKPEGLGLGLPISRSIIESHGGRLCAAGNEGGSGTTLRFILPACDRETA